MRTVPLVDAVTERQRVRLAEAGLAHLADHARRAPTSPGYRQGLRDTAAALWRFAGRALHRGAHTSWPPAETVTSDRFLAH